jgi:hypothetical protein
MPGASPDEGQVERGGFSLKKRAEIQIDGRALVDIHHGHG